MAEIPKYQKVSFISKQVFKNGSIKLHFIEPELYKVIYKLGFRFVRIENKPFIYFQDRNSRVRIIKHFQELRDAFVDYVKQLTIPAKEIDEILNAFYAKRPIKRNGLMEYYLKDTIEPGFWLMGEIKKQTESL